MFEKVVLEINRDVMCRELALCVEIVMVMALLSFLSRSQLVTAEGKHWCVWKKDL